MFNSWNAPSTSDTTGEASRDEGERRKDGSDALAAVAMDVSLQQSTSSSIDPATFCSSSSSRRRERSESNLDELLSAITNKMGSTDIKDSRSQLVAAFVEVMQCSDMEADFYLESSNMDIATAISLCMDAREDNESIQKTRSSGKRHRSLSDVPGYVARYTGKQLTIDGLPHGWLATVDKFSGQVLFLHIESGVTQFQVPPGFDDIPEKKKNGDDMNDTEELSMDDDTVLPSAMEDVIMKSGTEDTEGGNSVSSGGLSAAPVERMDAFDQHDEDL